MPLPARATQEVEARVGSTGSERWDSLPDRPPKVSLLQALRNDTHRMTSFLEQVDAYYVTSVREGVTGPLCQGGVVSSSAQPTWQIVIARKGEPFFPTLGPPGRPDPPQDPNQVDFWRLVVEGETGKIISSSSCLS